jgi:MFS family permease
VTFGWITSPRASSSSSLYGAVVKACTTTRGLIALSTIPYIAHLIIPASAFHCPRHQEAGPPSAENDRRRTNIAAANRRPKGGGGGGEKRTANMDKSLLGSVALLMMINIVDSITNSIVGPSLIFYVTEMGGSKEQYGMIMSASYLSGILMMSFYGAWVDSNGNRYRAPYAASFVMGMIGSIIYFMASTIRRISGGGWNEGSGVYAILLGRFVTGMGSSGRTLAYTWVATAIPHGEQRNVLTMLSMTRTFGMILGPMLNALIARVDATLVVGSRIVLPITPNNSPGLILFVMEGLLFVSMYAFLEDPPPIATKTGAVSLPSSYENRDHSYAASSKKARAIWNALVSFDVALPMTNLFFMMCNFTL